MSYALGVMGLGLGDFLDLTPFEWVGIRNRFTEYQNKAFKDRWEIARWQVFTTVCPPRPNTPGGFLKATDFIKFPWEISENSAKGEQKNEERFKAAVDRYK